MSGWPAGYPSRGPWLFRNVTQSFDFWPLLESISISQLHPDGIMSLSCMVEDRNATLSFDNSDEVYATFAGVRIFAGHIRVRNKTLLSVAGPRSWDLTGQDFTAKLDDSVILTEAERPRESIAARVSWILSHLNYAITTTAVNLPSENVEPATYEGSTVREALQQVSDERLLHFYVDFDKDLHMFRTETIAAPFDLSTSPDYSTSFPFSEFSLSADDIELTNAVRVKGKRHRTWRTDAASIADYGRQESAIIDDTLTTMEQVIAAGNRRLYQLSQPIQDGSLVCWEPGLRAGMTLQVTEDDWSIDSEYIVTEVEITAVDPHDEAGEALLRSEVHFTDRRRVGRFPGSGKDTKDANKPGDGGGGGGGGTEPPGDCCNPVPTEPAPFISWGEANVMGFEQGHSSGISHSITLPDGSGYVGGVVGGDVTSRVVLVFMMQSFERPNINTLDDLPAPWDPILSGGIACTHGVFPFNNGHPYFTKRAFMFEVDPNPGDHPATGATVVINSDDATEVLWVSVLVGGCVGVTPGPETTDWDMDDWTTPPDVATGNRNLYLSLAFNRYWNNTEHGLGLSAEDHDTPVISGLPADFTRLTQAVGGEKTINVDYAFSPQDTGSGLPDLTMTGYIGSSSGTQDFIETKLFALEVSNTGSGFITPGPTWEGGNPLLYDGGNTPSYTIAGDTVTITSSTMFDVWSWVAVGPPDLPTSIGDWIISQQFNLSEAGSLTDDGRRYLEIGGDFDGHYLAASVRFGDPQFAQGVAIDDEEDSFTAKDITEGEDYVFQVKWDGTTLFARFWLLADGEPAGDVWDVQSVTLEPALDPESDGLDRFYYSVGIGNDGGTPMVLELPSPTIEGLALAGEAVDWEIVGYGDNTTVTFLTRYPYDELSLHVRVDGQLLNGTAFTMDGAAGTITLDSAPYGDPSDPTGSSVVEARYTRT